MPSFSATQIGVTLFKNVSTSQLQQTTWLKLLQLIAIIRRTLPSLCFILKTAVGNQCLL